MTSTQHQNDVTNDFNDYLSFYQQVYTIQKAYNKHFHWTYAMFKTKFGIWIPDNIKKQKKKVTVEASVLDFVNNAYNVWCLENGVYYEPMLLSKVNK